MGIIPKTTILEFNGLPGVGKSTITQYLGDLAKKYEIPFYKTYYRHSFDRRAISLLLRPSILFLLPSILRFAYGYRGGVQKYRYVTGFLAYIREYLDFQRDIKNGLLVADQGLIQDFISIAHDSIIHDVGMVSSIMSKVEKYNIRFIRIDCDLSEEEVLFRLRRRENGGSRIEKNIDTEVKRLLSVQKNNLFSLRHELNTLPYTSHISIDASVSPFDNASKIWDIVYGKSEK